jgi:ElaA protein
MKTITKRFEELTSREIYEIGKIRSEVFVVEQKCIYLDLDGKDFNSRHLYFYDETSNEIVCYCRILDRGISYSTASIGRVLTNPKYRRKGYAREMLKIAIEIVREEMKESEITIGAQNYLKEFYSSLGFKTISDVYDEDGIPHIDMNLKV